MRSSRLLVAALFLIIGLLWIGQGSAVIEGSAMSGNPFWEVVGVILVVVGLAIAAREWISRPHAPR